LRENNSSFPVGGFQTSPPQVELGDVSPVVFDHLPTLFLIVAVAVSGLWEVILNDFRLFDVRLVDFKRLLPWWQKTGSGHRLGHRRRL